MTSRLLTAGLEATEGQAKSKLFARAMNALGTRASQAAAWWVPGRIEFLGKHTDYAGGRSLLCAAERGFVVVSVPRNDRAIRVRDASSRNVATGWLDADVAPKLGHWSSYPITVARRLARNFGPRLRGVDMAFASDLPSSAGLSSSSALIIATFLALDEANDLRSRGEFQRVIASTEDLAGYMGAIENGNAFHTLTGDRGVGTHGGSQDHTAILCARPRALVQYAFVPVRYERELRFPRDCILVIAASGVLASKTTNALTAYNRAANRAATALQVWQDTKGKVTRTIAELIEESSVDDFRRAVEHREDLPYSAESLINRIEQFRAELEIIRDVGDAFDKGDVASIGPLIDRSHANAVSLLENQVPETIALARAARELGAIAASAFGAGFGGSVYALVHEESAKSFLEKWRQRYIREFPKRASRATFFATRAGPPATRL